MRGSPPSAGVGGAYACAKHDDDARAGPLHTGHSTQWNAVERSPGLASTSTPRISHEHQSAAENDLSWLQRCTARIAARLGVRARAPYLPLTAAAPPLYARHLPPPPPPAAAAARRRLLLLLPRQSSPPAALATTCCRWLAQCASAEPAENRRAFGAPPWRPQTGPDHADVYAYARVCACGVWICICGT